VTQQSAGGGRDQSRPSISASLQEACITEPKGARHCPGCSQPIERVDLAVFDAGALFHRKCFVQGGGAYNLVHEFLRRHYPSAFCARYLSRTLDIPYEQAQNVIAALRIDGQTIILLGARCAGCRRSQLTVQAVTHDETQLQGPRADGFSDPPRRSVVSRD